MDSRQQETLSNLRKLACQTEEERFIECYPHSVLVVYDKGMPESMRHFGTTLDKIESKSPKDSLDNLEATVFNIHNPSGQIITVGKTSTNTICLPYEGISRTHAFIKKHLNEDYHIIQDNDSTNGTFLQKLKLPVTEWYRLNDSADLYFGGSEENGLKTQYFTPEGLYKYLNMIDFLNS